ncbi:MAG: DNA-directed polymerase specialized sigma subunit [Herminiimonas sp.]|nr:DNA-directed polymerase specialized sigma subunit [Herminiimonas sp.]
MNANELNFAYKVRHALNEHLDNLPADTTARLAAGRAKALACKKSDAPVRARMPQVAFAGEMGNFFKEPLSWFRRLSFAVPAIVLVAGLFGIYHLEQQQRISDTAEIDALVLSDELPLSAYLDHGFNAYLASQGE